jgi:hypothetical protein
MAGYKHTGIMDSEKLFYLRERDRSEKQLSDAISWAKTEEANNVFVNSEDNVAYVTAEMQVGSPMGWQEFEKKLKLLPCGGNLIFKGFDRSEGLEYRPFRSVYFRHPNGKEEYISAYGKTVLPEFSTMTLKTETVRDFGVRHIDRADMPKMKFNPNLGVLGGYETVDPNAVKPGWQNVQKYWGEDAENPQSRGWRTVLVRMVPRFCTPNEIEAIFGASNKRSWATGMGHKNLPSKF